MAKLFCRMTTFVLLASASTGYDCYYFTLEGMQHLFEAFFSPGIKDWIEYTAELHRSPLNFDSSSHQFLRLPYPPSAVGSLLSWCRAPFVSFVSSVCWVNYLFAMFIHFLNGLVFSVVDLLLSFRSSLIKHSSFYIWRCSMYRYNQPGAWQKKNQQQT